MGFDHNHYVPCLPWKQGEYQAVAGLSDIARGFITPLIEVPEIGFDFEKQKLSKTIDEHLAPFAKRVSIKWGQGSCFVDPRHLPGELFMADGGDPIEYIFRQLQEEDCNSIPVTCFSTAPSIVDSIKKIISKDKRGLCLRIGIEEVAQPDLKILIDKLLGKVKVKAEECDFILDLGAPNFEPVTGLLKLIRVLFIQIPYMEKWRTFTLLGTSFPPSMGSVKHGVTTIKRLEWILYTQLVDSMRGEEARIPTFGDYGIHHPQIPNLDMRLVKPSATIRYTIERGWAIIKGPNVRDNGYEQYRGLCNTLISSSYFYGQEFSAGDQFIFGCADGTGTTGNLTTWRKVGTNHHIETVVNDISSFFGSLE